MGLLSKFRKPRRNRAAHVRVKGMEPVRDPDGAPLYPAERKHAVA
jgi:hypothetical protein